MPSLMSIHWDRKKNDIYKNECVCVIQWVYILTHIRKRKQWKVENKKVKVINGGLQRHTMWGCMDCPLQIPGIAVILTTRWMLPRRAVQYGNLGELFFETQTFSYGI